MSDDTLLIIMLVLFVSMYAPLVIWIWSDVLKSIKEGKKHEKRS